MDEQAVNFERAGDVAVLVIDNPPVNALSHHMRVALSAQLDAAEADPAVRAVVITGKGRMFCAGADMKQLNAAPQDPKSPDIFLRIAALGKPVVAAIHGAALGGGFELALACHARIATPDAEMGLPELRLGLIPGAGGTFRLPRIIGAVAALDLIGSSRRLGAQEALELGVIDAMDADLRAAAIALARRLADGTQRPRQPGPGPREEFEQAAEKALRRARGSEALPALLNALRNGFDMPDEAAQRDEQALFQKLRAGPQSNAMRHMFRAEREAARLPADLSGTAQPIRRAAVIGAGTMGTGIAMSLAEGGVEVALIDAKADNLAAGMKRISAAYAASVKRGRISADQSDAYQSRIKGADHLAAAEDADLAIEAVFEDMALKQRIFADLDRILPDTAFLASNTSSLDIDALAAATGRPERVLGLHYFSPANVMRLLEIVRGKATSGDALASALALARQTGKQPVIAGNCPSFIGNRILRQRHHQAELLLQQGASPAEVDKAVTDFGMAMGPFQMNDLAGLDVGRLVRQAQGYALPVADALCARGRFGQKTGAGYYRYEDGRTPLPDPETASIIAAVTKDLGVTPRSFTPDEICQRLFYPMVNEAARILEEGIAARPGDIDVVYVHGYGFPAWRGGLLYWADTEGLEAIASALALWAEESGEARLQVAPLLAKLVREGRRFADWSENKEG